MPIRFRCAYCNQLMGIARRKAGTVVNCPKCQGQVVVPNAEAGAPDNGPASIDDSDFERQLSDIASQVPEAQIQIVGAPSIAAAPPVQWSPPQTTFPEMSGVHLTPGLMVLAGVLVLLLMGVSFFVGLLIGRSG